MPHHKHPPARGDLFTCADHRVVDAVGPGRLELEVVVREPGVLRILGLHVHDHHGLGGRCDVQPILLAQKRVAGHVVGEDGEDPGWHFGRLCRQRGELRLGRDRRRSIPIRGWCPREGPRGTGPLCASHIRGSRPIRQPRFPAGEWCLQPWRQDSCDERIPAVPQATGGGPGKGACLSNCDCRPRPPPQPVPLKVWL